MLTRGKSVFTPVFLSRLGPIFSRYVDLKRALGRRFDVPSRTLQSLDRFFHDHHTKYPTKYPDLNAAAFEAWCHTHERVSSGVRRVRMLEVCAFCFNRRRTEPQCFVPDSNSFPAYHERVKPYIFSEAEVAKLLRAASRLPRYPASPLRPEVIRLAIALLFTTGIRRGELLALTLGDYNRRESTLHIRETKFYNRACSLSIAQSPKRWIDICVCDPGGSFLFPRIRLSSGTPPGVEAHIAERLCDTLSSPCSGNAASSPQKGTYHGFTTFGIVPTPRSCRLPSKGTRLRAVWRGVPCQADRRKSA